MLSQTTEYALRAMACLAQRPGELVATPALAGQTRVPANYLAKILQQLATAGLINGRRGVGGGYQLSRPAAQVRLIEVIQAVGELRRIEVCPLGLAGHGLGLCPLHRRIDEAVAKVIDVFSGVTLHDLVCDPRSGKPLCDADVAAKVTVSAARR